MILMVYYTRPVVLLVNASFVLILPFLFRGAVSQELKPRSPMILACFVSKPAVSDAHQTAARIASRVLYPVFVHDADVFVTVEFTFNTTVVGIICRGWFAVYISSRPRIGHPDLSPIGQHDLALTG